MRLLPNQYLVSKLRLEDALAAGLIIISYFPQEPRISCKDVTTKRERTAKLVTNDYRAFSYMVLLIKTTPLLHGIVHNNIITVDQKLKCQVQLS
jgi:hypothetical protein